MADQIEDFLGYWLFYAQRSVAYAFNEALKECCLEQDKEYAVTPPQWGVLILLVEHDGMTMRAISRRRAVDMATVNGIVKRLEQNGLVERRHNLEDRRQVKVYLTDEGRDIMRYLPDAARKFQKIMMRGFSEEEQRDLIAKLQQIVVNVGQASSETGESFGLLLKFFDRSSNK